MSEISGNVHAMRALAQEYRDVAQEILTKTDANVRAMRHAVRADASRFTRDGLPAPVYQPLIAELDRAGERYLEGATRLRDKLQSDADALERLAWEYERSGEAAAADLRDTGTTSGPHTTT